MNYRETVTEDLKPSTPAHSAPAGADAFNLLHEIDALRSSASYSTGRHAARTLVRLPSLRVVLFVLQRHAELRPHHTAQPMTLQMLAGRICIALPGQSIEQAAGEMLLLGPDLTHDVTALVDSAFLLSMPWSERAGA